MVRNCQVFFSSIFDELVLDSANNKITISSSKNTCTHWKSTDAIFKGIYVELEIALRKDGTLFFITPAFDFPFLCDLQQTFTKDNMKIEIGESTSQKYFFYDCPFRENMSLSP